MPRPNKKALNAAEVSAVSATLSRRQLEEAPAADRILEAELRLAKFQLQTATEVFASENQKLTTELTFTKNAVQLLPTENDALRAMHSSNPEVVRQ